MYFTRSSPYQLFFPNDKERHWPLWVCRAAMLLSKLPSVLTNSQQQCFPYGCQVSGQHQEPFRTGNHIWCEAVGIHVPVVSSPSDTLETTGDKRHICLLDHFLEQTQLFQTLESLYFHVHKHNAFSRSPKANRKLKKRLPFRHSRFHELLWPVLKAKQGI